MMIIGPAGTIEHVPQFKVGQVIEDTRRGERYTVSSFEVIDDAPRFLYTLRVSSFVETYAGIGWSTSTSYLTEWELEYLVEQIETDENEPDEEENQ